MAKPKLNEIEKMLSKGNEFSLTESQYAKSTGTNIPKAPSYLLKNSAIAKMAENHGYKIQLNEKTLIFVRVK